MFFFNTKREFLVDLVYLWCDGSDPEFAQRKAKAMEQLRDEAVAPDAITIERWTNHDELKYSLRSVCKFLPWLNNIYILMDQQPPCWLRTDTTKLKCIQHKEVIPKNNFGPYFNSTAIETFLHRIPGLEEHFLYSNDDMFVGRTLKKSYFFTRKGMAIQYVSHKNFLHGRLGDSEYHNLIKSQENESQFERMILHSNKLIYDEFRQELCIFPSHQIDAYNKSVLREQIEDSPLKKYTEETRRHIFRNDNDIHRTIYAWRAAVQGKMVLKHLMLNHPRLEKYIPLVRRQRVCSTTEDFKRIVIGKTPLFCLNGTYGNNEEYYRKCKFFLEKSFPDKSPYEK